MKRFLISIAAVAMIMLPAAADAAQCRNTATGKFAKCGAAGSVPASQYVAKSKLATTAKTVTHATAVAKPVAARAKPGMMAMFKPKPKATPAPVAKVARCKNAKSKFVKCGTPGAKPA